MEPVDREPGISWEPAPRSEVVVQGDGWIRVALPEVDGPVLARLARTRDGRLAVTGLVLGAEGSGSPEITASTLRQISPARIASAVQAELLRKPAEGETVALPVDPQSGLGQLRAALGMAGPQVRQADAVGHWKGRVRWLQDATGRAAEVENRAPGRPAIGPGLEDFAAVFREEFLKAPQRATAATAERLGLSRATANRRIRACRERGLLPTPDRSILEQGESDG